MKAAIMQPYFFPYIGYFQLIQTVDLFILYDRIKYTKKGWINRNRFLMNGRDAVFTVPLKKDSDALDVVDRSVSPDFKKDKLLNKLREAYHRAPYFKEAFPVFENAVKNEDRNLFRFVRHSIVETCKYLGIESKIATSSEFQTDSSLRHQERVMALCKAAGAGIYVNPIGGQEFYSKETFGSDGVQLRFLKPKSFEYRQFEHPFVPWLSIIDVMMFNSKEVIAHYLSHGYDLL